MTIVIRNGHAIECLDTGSGPAVVLLHGSGGNRRQWEPLAALLASRRRVIAPDLPGYGGSAAWTEPATAGLAAPAAMVRALVADVPGPVDLVGHSWGASVALEAAARLGQGVRSLVLFEPNLFGLLDGPARAEIQRLHARIRLAGLAGDWMTVAACFTDYFHASGSWAALPAARREAMAAALRPNLDEWLAVMDPSIDPGRWQGVTARTLLMTAADTRPALLAVADRLHRAFDGWERHELPRGGHMAPLVRARAFNDVVTRFLETES